MLHKFNKWREAKQATYTSLPDMHFHKCSDIHYGVVHDLLRKIVSCYVAHGQRVFVIRPTEFEVNAFYFFLDEMQFGYIHPRSTSARIAFVRSEKCYPNPSTL